MPKFHGARIEAAISDDDPVGNADQLRVREHHARAHLTIVEQDLDARCAQIGVELLRRLAQPDRLVHVHRQQDRVKRRNGHRPHDALLVVVLFDRGGDHAGHPDPVAAHDQVDRTALVVEDHRAHRSAVLVAELKDVSDLDSPADRERPVPSGLGSPSTALRRSATTGSSVSRPQFTPVRCAPSRLAPHTKSASAAAEPSAMTGTPAPTGPSDPGSHPMTSRTRSGRAKVSGASTPSVRSALIALRS